MEQVERLASWLRESKSVVVLTGAGMSTESGIPDFRSKGGWWNGINPMTIATIEAFERDYDLFHAFYCKRLEVLENCQPHEGHKVLARLQEKGMLQTIATQNVDNFHQLAGAQGVYELHGNLQKVRCQKCGKPSDVGAFQRKEACLCGGLLRPGVVLFGEFLPEDDWKGVLQEIMVADLVIVIGTSLQVAPVNQLPNLTSGKKVYINMDTSKSAGFDLVIEGSAKETLQQLELVLQQG